MKTVYDFTVKDRKGKDVSLKEYANEVLLIVTLPPSAVLLRNMRSWRNFTRGIMLTGSLFLTSRATNSASRHPEQTRPYTRSAS